MGEWERYRGAVLAALIGVALATACALAPVAVVIASAVFWYALNGGLTR